MVEKRFFVEGDRFSLYNIKTPQIPEKFYYVLNAEFAHYEYKWSKDVSVNTESGPENIEDLEPGRKEVIYQVIFGIKPAKAYIYVAIPTDVRLYGVAEEAIPRDGFREVGAITGEMSPYDEPDFITELFLMKDTSYEYPSLYAYNPTNKPIRPQLKFLVNKIEPEEITEPEVIEAMKRRKISYRRITLGWKER
jgi:hypothetical protein